jgi:hypothetical protein
MRTKLKLASVLAALLLAACADPLSAPVDEAAASGGAGQNGGHTVIFPADPGKGLALLSVSGAPAASRVVLPDLGGKTYSYRYYAEAEEEDPLSGDFAPGETTHALQLNPGLWTITVRAWEGEAPAEDAENPPVPAFVGRAELALGTGETKPLTVGLLPNGEGSGTFSYAVTFTDGGQNFPANLGYAFISLFPLDGGGAVDVIDLFNNGAAPAAGTVSGQTSLANGYYHITTAVNYKDGVTQKFAAKREVLYIYDGLTSAYEVAFGTEDFCSLLVPVQTDMSYRIIDKGSLGGIWSGSRSLYSAFTALPQNTPDTPYIIALTGYKLDGTETTNGKRLGNTIDPLEDLFAVTQGRYVFYDLSGCVGNKIATVDSYAVQRIRQYKDRVTGLILPETVTTLENFLFSGSTSLAYIALPSGLTAIGENVFYDCSSLASIDIPANVTKMGKNVFYGCTSLKSITLRNSTSIQT